jgi:RimJ/RimL family protein N-acetyltransferase
MTEAGEEKWIENIGNDKHNFPLMIVLKGKTLALDRPIGTIGIHRLDYENRIAVTGAAIGEKDCWGKGYGTEAKMLLLDFAFNTLNLRKIYSHVLVNNPRSKRYSEKCGYVIEAKLPQHHFRDGTYVDEWILAVYAETWQTLWAKTKKKYLP